MNVNQVVPQSHGVAAQGDGHGVAPAASGGGGLADLFAAMLASLQATLTHGPASAVEHGAEGSIDPNASCANCDGTVEHAPIDGAASDDHAEADGITAAQSLHAALNANAAAAGSHATVPPTATVEAAEADGVVVPHVPSNKTAGTPADAKEIPHPLPAEHGELSGEPMLTAKAHAAAKEPHAGPPGSGAMAIEVMREGQPQAKPTEGPPGRTVRELVHEVVAIAREQTRANAQADAAKPVDASTATAVAASVRPEAETVRDAVLELKPAVAEASPKPATSVIAPALATGNGDVASGGVKDAPVLDAARAALPASVDVHDVGDVTVRSVRYLSGRTEETVTVRLVPRSLGELQIAVRASADGLEVVLTAAGHAARERLEGQLVGLRDLLAREGLDVNRVSVQAPPSFDLSGQMPSHQQSQQQTGHAPRFSAQAFRQNEPQPSEPQTTRNGRPQHEGGLNMLA